MSRHACTVHFSRPLSSEDFVGGFRRAAEEANAAAFLLKGRRQLELSRANLDLVMSEFAAHDFVGEVRWKMEREKIPLFGKLTYPIQSPITMPGTLEFDFVWQSPQEKAFFDSVGVLLRVLRCFFESVSGDNLIVEPKKLPMDIHDVRYERFKTSVNDRFLSSIDWIIGFRKSDRSDWVAALKRYAYSCVEASDVMICAFSENPLDYSRLEDRALLDEIERALGI